MDGALASAAPAGPQAPPADWRDAPLFVVRLNDGRTTAAPQSADTRATIPARDSSRSEPQDGSIFVARASDGGTP